MVAAGVVAAPIANPVGVVAALSKYAFRLAVVASPGVSRICGVEPNAFAKTIFAKSPPLEQPVPVVTVTVPLLSVPDIAMTGEAQAAEPAVIVGVVPVVMR